MVKWLARLATSQWAWVLILARAVGVQPIELFILPFTIDNTQLLARPPDIHPSEYSLPREDRVHLARLRYRQHPALLSYQKRLDGSIADACPGCNTTPNTIKHIMEDCTVRNHTHQQHNIHSMKAPWESPVQAMTYLRRLGLFGHLA
ncbi:hypothetical protein GWK47_020637 [Chionoecetes opilio]|uniref:Uncharacterized protein n=1 Tax=Chionoecetes opilio TaxID=41210 RepID=A0A8J5CIA0_CHIOP|nr:hypothetical protein GWK47_020637 [Chionoecetes opilio]